MIHLRSNTQGCELKTTPLKSWWKPGFNLVSEFCFESNLKTLVGKSKYSPELYPIPLNL